MKLNKPAKFLSVFLGVFSLMETVSALPLEEAVRTALQTNPDIGIVIEGQRAVEHELNQARSRFYPTVDLSLGAGHQYTNDTSTRAAASGGDYVTMNRYESRLTVSQMLYDGDATASEVERQRSRVVAASRRVRDTAQTIALDAVQAYLEARRQRELFQLNEDNVRMHQDTLDLVTVKVSGGAATVADQQQAASRLAQAETALEDARARLRDADATYSRVIGETPRDLERPNAPFWAMPQSVDEAIDWAIDSNPAVAVAKADLDTSFKEFDNAKSSYLPTVRLELGADANRNIDGTRGSEYNIEAMVRLNYNLYRGGEDYYRRQEFLSRIAESRQTYNREIRLTEEAMRLAWNARDSAVARVKAQRREVEANDVVRQTYRQQFDLGGRSLLELLDAENEYFFAHVNLISTEFQAVFSVYEVLATGGVLISSLSLQPPIESNSDFDTVAPLEANFENRDNYPNEFDPVLGVEEFVDSPALLEGSGQVLDPNQLLELEENSDSDLNDLLIDDIGDSDEILDPNAFFDGDISPSLADKQSPAHLDHPEFNDDKPSDYSGIIVSREIAENGLLEPDQELMTESEVGGVNGDPTGLPTSKFGLFD